MGSKYPRNILFNREMLFTALAACRAGVDAWSCHDLHRGDVIVWPTSLGWMMGPWLVYSALLNSCTIGLFLGAPGTRAYGEFVESSRVTVLGTVPSMVKAWRDSDCMRGLDWSSLRCMSSSGEVCVQDVVSSQLLPQFNHFNQTRLVHFRTHNIIIFIA